MEERLTSVSDSHIKASTILAFDYKLYFQHITPQLHVIMVAKAIITDALKPFPEAAYAIGAAFIAYYRGQLDIEAILARSEFGESPATGSLT